MEKGIGSGRESEYTKVFRGSQTWLHLGIPRELKILIPGPTPEVLTELAWMIRVAGVFKALQVIVMHREGSELFL